MNISWKFLFVPGGTNNSVVICISYIWRKKEAMFITVTRSHVWDWGDGTAPWPPQPSNARAVIGLFADEIMTAFLKPRILGGIALLSNIDYSSQRVQWGHMQCVSWREFASTSDGVSGCIGGGGGWGGGRGDAWGVWGGGCIEVEEDMEVMIKVAM